MRVRLIMVLLLIVTLAIVKVGQPLQVTDNAEQAPKLTAEEQREAHALCEEFLTRLDKTGDVTTLLDDLYVSDFLDRFPVESERIFPLAIKREVAEEASLDERRRAYSGSINCLYLLSRLCIAAQIIRDIEEEDESELRIEEIIPPSVINLLRTDPVVEAILEQELEEERAIEATDDPACETVNSETPKGKALDDSHQTKLTKLHEIVPLKSLDSLRHYTRMMEQALDLMREHLKSLPPEKNPSLCDFWSSRTKDGVIEEEPIKLYVTVLDSEFMGYTKGTPLICADVMVFHLDIVRAERGRLKILAAYLLSH